MMIDSGKLLYLFLPYSRGFLLDVPISWYPARLMDVALYADMTFAKGELVDICLLDGVPFVPWNDFDEVRHALETTLAPPGPVTPIQCPGWTIS